MLTPRERAPRGDAITWTAAVDRPLGAVTRLMRHRRILEAAALAEGIHLAPWAEADSVGGLSTHAARGWSLVDILERSPLSELGDDQAR